MAILFSFDGVSLNVSRARILFFHFMYSIFAASLGFASGLSSG